MNEREIRGQIALKAAALAVEEGKCPPENACDCPRCRDVWEESLARWRETIDGLRQALANLMTEKATERRG